MRRFMTGLVIAALAATVGPIQKASAQGGPYSIRGGPIYGGPVFGGGPSYYAGAYSQPYFGPQLSGAGYGAMFIGTYPQFNAIRANDSLPYYGSGIMPYNPTAGVVYNPAPRPEGPIPIGPPSPNESRPNSTSSAEGARTTPATATTPGTTPLPDARPVQPAIGRAWFKVALPADAKLWVNDAPTTQAGANRRFQTSPDLDPLRTYEYVFRAQWRANGETVTRDKTVRFKTGDDLPVDFTQTAAR